MGEAYYFGNLENDLFCVEEGAWNVPEWFKLLVKDIYDAAFEVEDDERRMLLDSSLSAAINICADVIQGKRCFNDFEVNVITLAYIMVLACGTLKIQKLFQTLLLKTFKQVHIRD